MKTRKTKVTKSTMTIDDDGIGANNEFNNDGNDGDDVEFDQRSPPISLLIFHSLFVTFYFRMITAVNSSARNTAVDSNAAP